MKSIVMINVSSLECNIIFVNHMIELFLCWPIHEENPMKFFKVSFDSNISAGWVLPVVHNI